MRGIYVLTIRRWRGFLSIGGGGEGVGEDGVGRTMILLVAMRRVLLSLVERMMGMETVALMIIV
jgi:hypothetical protein